jgi:two-component system NtrC family sensor kinase
MIGRVGRDAIRRLNNIIGGGIVKKFIIWTVAIIVLLDILAANFMLSDINKTLSFELNETGSLLVKDIAHDSGERLAENNSNLTRLILYTKNADKDVKYVYITDARNNIIAGTFPGNLSQPGGENIVDFKAQIPGRGGFAHVGMDRTFINVEINNQTHIIILNILIESGLGLLMVFIAGIYLTRPIRALVRGAQEIGKGNFGYEIEIGSTDDEFKTLSNTFNQMAHDLSESTSELRKLSTAVEEAPDGIRITDPDGYIIYSNKATEEIVGFSPEELKGKHINELMVVPEFASNVIIPSIKDTGSWVGELIVRHKDGREIPISLNTSIVRNAKDMPIAMVGIFRDITDQKEKENLKLQLLHADKLASIGQLAAGTAHEMNNPLGNISLYAQMLLKKAEDEDTKEKLMVINNEANRAAKIVNELLDFARQSELKLSNIDINNEIDRVLTILKPQLKGIRINTDLKPLPLILADGGQIQQVIMNLLTNSIQSITENGDITIKSTANPSHVEISISDNGCGIPKENLDKIFDPFFTTKEPGKGTGLGLSISYGILKRHNGLIEVKSEVGKGTIFTIKLPV